MEIVTGKVMSQAMTIEVRRADATRLRLTVGAS